MENQTVFPVIPSRGRVCVTPCPIKPPPCPCTGICAAFRAPRQLRESQDSLICWSCLGVKLCDKIKLCNRISLENSCSWSMSRHQPLQFAGAAAVAVQQSGDGWMEQPGDIPGYQHGCQGTPVHGGRGGCPRASGTGHICCCCWGHRHRILILKCVM